MACAGMMSGSSDEILLSSVEKSRKTSADKLAEKCALNQHQDSDGFSNDSQIIDEISKAILDLSPSDDDSDTHCTDTKITRYEGNA